jgi:hypothetical protein
MLTFWGLLAIIIAVVVRLRWKWTPRILIVLGVLFGLHLVALDVALADQRPPIAIVATLLGGLYLVSLAALALRSLGEKR